MPPVLFYSLGPVLLLAHALSSGALCGVAIHLALTARRAQAALPPHRALLLRRYARWVFWGYLAAGLSGAVLYPRYRYYIRGLYLDRYAPWASNLFDLKENLATLGLPLAAAVLLLVPAPSEPDDPAAAPPAYSALRGQLLLGCSLGVALIVAFNVIAGVLCTGVRGA